MDRQMTLFMDKLKELMVLSRQSGQEITDEYVRNYFLPMALDDAQIMQVKTYLSMNDIQTTTKAEPDTDDGLYEEIISGDLLPKGIELGEAAQIYMEEIQTIKILTKDEEAALVKALLDGDNNASIKLQEAYLRVVVKIAGQHTDKGLMLMDLIQEGNMGLLEAVSTYKNSEKSFAAHAIERIKAAIFEALDQQNDADRLPAHMVDVLNKVNDFKETWMLNHDEAPAMAEIAAALDMDEERIEEIIRISKEEMPADAVFTPADFG